MVHGLEDKSVRHLQPSDVARRTRAEPRGGDRRPKAETGSPHRSPHKLAGNESKRGGFIVPRVTPTLDVPALEAFAMSLIEAGLKRGQSIASPGTSSHQPEEECHMYATQNS